MKKKQTIGERIAGHEFCETDITCLHCRGVIARRIDAAIRRAVREAFHPSPDASREYQEAERNRVARKYGVRL